MIEAGILQIYGQTQFIDFGFIAAVIAVSVLFGTLAARLAARISGLGVRGWHPPGRVLVHRISRNRRLA